MESREVGMGEAMGRVAKAAEGMGAARVAAETAAAETAVAMEAAMEAEAMAEVTEECQTLRQHSNARHAAHKLQRTDRSCYCRPAL